MSDHSVTGKDFKLLVSTLYSFSDPDASDAEDESKALAELVGVIASRNAKHELSLADRTEYMEIASFIAFQRKAHSQSKAGRADVPQQVQEAEWYRMHYYF